MKLQYTEGCVCTSLLVDDEELNELPADKQKEVALAIFSYISNDPLAESDRYQECLRAFYECYLDENMDLGGNVTPDDFYNEVDKRVASFMEMAIDKKIEVCKEAIKSMDGRYGCAIQELYLKATQHLGKNKFCFHCDDCGDSVYEYTLEI